MTGSGRGTNHERGPADGSGETDSGGGPRRRQFLRASAATGLGGLALGMTSPAAADAPDVPPEDFHLYLAFGQSNMEGQGEVEPQDRETNPRVRVLQDKTCSDLNREYGEWYVAEPPLNRCNEALGPLTTFGKTMAAERPEDVHVGLVPAAVSGADIRVFEKGAPIGAGDWSVPEDFAGGYPWLLDLAERAQEVGTIEGILFHQGESNAGEESWIDHVQGIVGDLKSDLGIGDVPFLAGEMLYESEGGCCASHNSLVNELPNVIPNAHVVSAEGLGGADYAHFTSEGYRELGRRYAERMLEVNPLDDEDPPEPPGGDPPPVGDNENAPTDPDGDDLYEDVNGNGGGDLADAVDLYQDRNAGAVQDNVDAYDFSGNDEIDLADVVQLYQENTD